eukprot:Sspe_Gene.77384::Locus_48351_Transcript_1_1_Confidence_1.000_Length_684::g.77384::m.77384
MASHGAAVPLLLAVSFVVGVCGVQHFQPGVDKKIFSPPCPSCTDTDTIQGYSVVIEDGYEASTDTLVVQGKAMGREVVNQTTMKVEEAVQAISEVQFRSTASGGKPRRISYKLGGYTYLNSTGHFYHVFHESHGLTWSEAQQRCSSPERDFMGLVGYLATFTDKGEMEHALSGYSEPVLVGFSDVGEEGVARWVTGPEGCPAEYDLSKGNHNLT